jgi:GrpB-like predicted nucleotidyltransferase (UPF0157 family)
LGSRSGSSTWEARQSQACAPSLCSSDYLREHPAAAERVAEAKRALAARFPREREAYTEGKTLFVQEILRLALA